MAGSLYEKPGLMRHARFNVAQAFDEMVRSFSDRPAVVFDEAHAVTYRQLDHLSNQIAGFLLAKGIRKGDRIAISMEKSLSAYALIVAALKTGAIYVALDPRNPAARREAILDQCSPCVLFSDAATDGQRIPVVLCPGKWEAPAFCESFATTSPDSSRIAGSDAAYIMFTSGSTGHPKGAVHLQHDLPYNTEVFAKATMGVNEIRIAKVESTRLIARVILFSCQSRLRHDLLSK